MSAFCTSAIAVKPVICISLLVKDSDKESAVMSEETLFRRIESGDNFSIVILNFMIVFYIAGSHRSEYFMCFQEKNLLYGSHLSWFAQP